MSTALRTPQRVIAEHQIDHYGVDGEMYQAETEYGGCICNWQGKEADHAEHVVSALKENGFSIVQVPDDIKPEGENWYRVRGYEYYGGDDEDMPIGLLEAHAADLLAIARYRRIASAGGES